MRFHFQTLAVSVALLGLVASVGAQTSMQTHKSAIEDALSAAADNGTKACNGVDCVMAACQEAKQSNDVKKMRSALDLAQKELADSKKKAHHATKIAEVLHDQMTKIDDQRARVKEEQAKLDALEYPTDEFVIND